MFTDPRATDPPPAGRAAIPGAILLGTVGCALWWGLGGVGEEPRESALYWCVLGFLLGQWVTWGVLVDPPFGWRRGPGQCPWRRRALFSMGVSHLALGLLNARFPLLESGRFLGSGPLHRWIWTSTLLLFGIGLVASAWKARPTDTQPA
jgi:hypothetical protein